MRVDGKIVHAEITFRRGSIINAPGTSLRKRRSVRENYVSLRTSFRAITTRDTIERSEIGEGPLWGRIHIWLLHFACDSYTMRSIGSCRLLLPLSDCGTSASLFPLFILCPDEIPTYPRLYLFGPMEKYESEFLASSSPHTAARLYNSRSIYGNGINSQNIESVFVSKKKNIINSSCSLFCKIRNLCDSIYVWFRMKIKLFVR